MRYLQKGAEPASFTAWKNQANTDWQPTYEDLRGDEKRDVYDALLKEQGYTCCYCEMRIGQSKCHIDHFKPQSLFPDQALDYANFLASCMGTGEETKTGEKLSGNSPNKPLHDQHCGGKRGNWYDPTLLVSPWAENCAEYFRYTGDGEMLPTKEPTMQAAARETIEKLNLNYPPLQNLRKKTIAPLLHLTNEEIQEFIQAYCNPDQDGKIGPFAGAVIYVLQSLLP